MDDISKQQLILLALLVSFVTSLATGIVTVSLMDQAPDGTTRTVSQVIEKTIQQIVPADSAADSGGALDTNSLPADPQSAAATMEKSLVRFQSRSGGAMTGIGIVVSKSGAIVTDKSAIAGLSDYAVALADGTVVPVSVIRSQDNGDIVFLAPAVPIKPGSAFNPAEFDDQAVLGQAVLSLSGTSTYALGQGIVSQLPASTSESSARASVQTTIAVSKALPGSPLFDLSGAVIGIRTSSLADGDGASFYAIQPIEAVIPK